MSTSYSHRDEESNLIAETEPLLPIPSTSSTNNQSNNNKNNKKKSILNLSQSESYTWWICVSGILLGFIIISSSVILFKRAHAKQQLKDTPDFTKLPPPNGIGNPKYLVSGYNGAVASEVDLCSKVGVEVLKEGGTATDAAIATALCIGSTNMFSSGIGGGGFLVIRPSTSHKNLNPNCVSPISIDFRETAPTGSYAKMYTARLNDTTFDPARASKIGGLAVGVPGEIRGLEAAYKQCGGGVSWARLFQPAADIARASPVGRELGRRLNFSFIPGGDPLSAWMLKEKDWSAIFAPGGKMLQTGEILRREAYALTLEKIGREGADVFYNGAMADSMVATVQSTGGLLTTSDLANYKAIVLPAIQATYRNRTYYTTHAPSGGPIIISLLNTLETYSDYANGGKTSLAVHRLIESLKFAFAARTELGDPAFMKNDSKIAEFMTKEFAAGVRAKITDNMTHTVDYYNPQFDIKDTHGTTHLSVIDKYGSAVSLTTTVNLLFGSRVMDFDTGIIMNDEMDDFATPGLSDAFGLKPSPYNFPAPHKRPLSSTAPLIMDSEDGEVYLAVGGSGGSRIFGSVAQAILNLDWGYDLSNSIELPRVHDQLSPAYVSVESGFRPDIIEDLITRGHNISMFDINVGVAECQAVLRTKEGKLFAASDSRKNGVPAAF